MKHPVLLLLNGLLLILLIACIFAFSKTSTLDFTDLGIYNNDTLIYILNEDWDKNISINKEICSRGDAESIAFILPDKNLSGWDIQTSIDDSYVKYVSKNFALTLDGFGYGGVDYPNEENNMILIKLDNCVLYYLNGDRYYVNE